MIKRGRALRLANGRVVGDFLDQRTRISLRRKGGDRGTVSVCDLGWVQMAERTRLDRGPAASVAGQR